MKNIKIELLPKDFKDSSFGEPTDCALAKAATRRFNQPCSCCTETLRVWGGYAPYSGESTRYKIKDEFGPLDYDYVKSQYRKDPKAEKTRYYVTLIPQ